MIEKDSSRFDKKKFHGYFIAKMNVFGPLSQDSKRYCQPNVF